MQTFKDSKNRTWTLNLSYLKLKELDAIDWTEVWGDPYIKIMQPHSDVFQEVLLHTPTCLEMIWHIVKDHPSNSHHQHNSIANANTTNGISSLPEDHDPYLDFAEAVGANTETIKAATDALYKELEDFFPVLKTTRERYSKLIESIGEERLNKFLEIIENTPDNSGTKSIESAESLESTGDPVLNEN